MSMTDDPRYIQVQLADVWLKLDRKHGFVIGSSKEPYEDTPVYELKPKRAARKAHGET